MAGPGPPGGLELELLAEPHALFRLPATDRLPDWASEPGTGQGIVSIGRTAEELSIVCPERLLPSPAPAGAVLGRAALRVSGTLEHSLTGVLAVLAAPLAEAGVPIFAISTWDTDYLLVAADDVERAVAALAGAGHRVTGAQGA